MASIKNKGTALVTGASSGIGAVYADLPIHNLPSAIVMTAEDIVDAAWAGLEQGEVVTIPALPDKAERDAFEAARRAMSGRLSNAAPAVRYNVYHSQPAGA